MLSQRPSGVFVKESIAFRRSRLATYVALFLLYPFLYSVVCTESAGKHGVARAEVLWAIEHAVGSEFVVLHAMPVTDFYRLLISEEEGAQ